MLSLENLKNRILAREKGATAVEYTVLLALIIVILIVLIQAVGVQLQGVWQQIQAALGIV